MKIEFTPVEIDERQARGLVALLTEIHGTGIIPASYEQVGSVARATGPANITIHTDATLQAQSELAPAVDGYPTAPQPPADNDHVEEGATPFPEAPAPLNGQVGSSLDTAGIPWDERIHASTKTTNKDGTWTRRRNTPDETFDAVMAELKGAAPVTTPAIPAPPAPATIPGARDFTAPPAPAAEPTASEAFAAPAPVPTPPAPAAATPSASAPTFLTLMQKLTPLQGAGKLDKPTLDAFLLDCGIEGLGKMAAPGLDDARIKMGKILDADDDTRAAIAASEGENRAALLAMVWA